ncbi:MAG: dehydrogenase [Chloroflexota bacterium]|nr:MAG: dehydrogenase [Chloroflexota bacterium]
MNKKSGFSVIGRPHIRLDALDKVTGRTVYGTDLQFQGMLYAKVLWSDRSHARIVRLDTSKAEALPGVHAVVTAKDASKKPFGVYLKDQCVFANEKTRHSGEAIAAVAAESQKIATKAIGLIEIEYENLPAVFDPYEAMEPDAPLVHPDIESYEAIYPAIKYGNVAMYSKLSQGDLEAGFSDADHVFEDTFTTQPIHQAYIEPRSAVAGFDFNGKLTVYTSNQQIFPCQLEVSAALDWPLTKVRVIGAGLGGGFGGKLKASVEPIVALLARKSGRSVRLTLTREEEHLAGRPVPPYSITIKMGVKNNGQITAKRVKVVADCGGYSDHALGTVGLAMTFAQGPYDIPNAEVTAYAVYTNNPNFGCMRGYGAKEMNYANEAQMDKVAARIEIDPVEFRQINIASEGTQILSTQKLRSVSVSQTMQAALTASNWEERNEWKEDGRGIGMANIILNMGLLSSSAIIKLNEDGTINLLTGAMDLGTGNQTALAQIVAEEMGIPLSETAVAAVDSDSSPYDLGPIASRTVFDTGNAFLLAAKDAKKQMLEVAAGQLKVPVDRLSFGESCIYIKDNPTERLSFAAIAGISLFFKGGPIIGRGAYLGEPGFNEPVGEGYPQPPSKTFVFGTHVAEVTVDRETGQITVDRLTAAHDVGQVINPQGVVGQIEGGGLQGISCTLWEELLLDKGQVCNPSFLDYRLPTFLDAPPIEAVVVEMVDETGPFGAKGLGEPPIMGPMAAITNAIYDAVGVWVHDLPITPEKVLKALDAQAKENQKKFHEV